MSWLFMLAMILDLVSASSYVSYWWLRVSFSLWPVKPSLDCWWMGRWRYWCALFAYSFVRFLVADRLWGAWMSFLFVDLSSDFSYFLFLSFVFRTFYFFWMRDFWESHRKCLVWLDDRLCKFFISDLMCSWVTKTRFFSASFRIYTGDFLYLGSDSCNKSWFVVFTCRCFFSVGCIEMLNGLNGFSNDGGLYVSKWNTGTEGDFVG